MVNSNQFFHSHVTAYSLELVLMKYYWYFALFASFGGKERISHGS